MRSRLAVLMTGIWLVLAASARGQSAMFAGVWQGVLPMGRGDQAVTLVLRPRGPSGIEGMMYLDGEQFGSLEEGRARSDSLAWRVLGFDFTAARSGDRLSADLHVHHGAVHHFELERSPHDTTWAPTLPPSASPAAPLVREEPPDSVYRAHAVPTSTVSSVDSCLRRGTLLLVGGGAGQPDLDRRFVELAGGPAARIVLIPTATLATSDSAELRRFSASVSRILGVKSITVLHTTSRREADSEAFARPLREATGVLITGGEASWLLDSYLGTRTERELIALLSRGGVISGTSAGAIIWGSTTMIFQAHSGGSQSEQMREENLLIGHPHGVGFAVLRNIAVQAHLSEFRLEHALRKLVNGTPGLLGLGIDEATALEVHGDVARVLGRGTVRMVSGSLETEPLVLREGDRYDLVKRARP